MRAMAFSSYGPADVLVPVDRLVPEPGPGQLRIRVAAAAINPADWRLRAGQFRFFRRLRLPFVPGSDVAGVVDAVGPDVPDLQPGDHVFAMVPAFDGGAYAEYVLASAQHVARAPAGLSLAEAASLPLCGLTALQALRKAGVQPGQRVLVYGASGGVGTLAVQIARVLGGEVTAVTSTANRELAAGLGAHQVLDYTRDDLSGLHDAFDVVFDAVNHLPFRRARRLLRPRGVALTVNPFAAVLHPGWLRRLRGGRVLRSVLARPSGADLTWLAEQAAAGSVRPVVERSYPLEQVVEAHRRSETGHARGKLVLVVDEELAATAVARRQPTGGGPTV